MRFVPVAAGVGLGLVGAVTLRATERRWAAAEDPTGGTPLREAGPDVDTSVLPTADGAELSVVQAGPVGAPTVVLVHCWTGDRRVWGPVATRLVEDHRVVLYDHRGHGRSTVGAAGLTLDALADDLRAVLEHVDARDAVVAGHSMGGMTTQAFAIRHPDVLADRVAGLALVATACDGLRSGFGRIVGPAVSGHAAAAPLLRRGTLGRLLVRSSVGQVACRSHLDAIVETFVATAPAVRAGCQRSLLAMDLTAGLPSVDVPVVIVSGTRDAVTPTALSRRMAELLPDARLEILPGIGHMLPWEVPDRLVTLIAELARAAPRTVAPTFPSPSVG